MLSAILGSATLVAILVASLVLKLAHFSKREIQDDLVAGKRLDCVFLIHWFGQSISMATVSKKISIPQNMIAVMAVLALILGGQNGYSQEREFKPFIFKNLYGKFKPIKKFPIVKATESGLEDNELVIGVEIEGHARAYPINMLTGPSREILNDELGKMPIAATW